MISIGRSGPRLPGNPCPDKNFSVVGAAVDLGTWNLELGTRSGTRNAEGGTPKGEAWAIGNSREPETGNAGGWAYSGLDRFSARRLESGSLQ